MGLLLPELVGWAEAGIDLAPLARRLEAARAAAMDIKDFSEVDRLKAAYLGAGLEVRMSKQGVELLPGPGFDPAKLEALP